MPTLVSLNQNMNEVVNLFLLAVVCCPHFFSILCLHVPNIKHIPEQQVISENSPHSTTCSPTHAHRHFLSADTPAVHGGPAVGGGVCVSAVSGLVIPLEAVSTDEHVLFVT